MTEPRIRPACAADHTALKEVCLKTGDSGADGTHLHDDPELLGLIYAVPYQVFAPDFAFALEDAKGVCGYAFGAPDTRAFLAWMEAVWLPPLWARLINPGPDPARWRMSDWARRRVFAPPSPPVADLARFPAHAHIDLLPRAQGRGLGRAMMARVTEALRAAGCAGVFLEVSPRNIRAQGFYRRLGFRVLHENPDAVTMGKALI